MVLPLANLDSKAAKPSEKLPTKVRDAIKAMSIPVQGPVWHLILKASMTTITKALNTATAPHLKPLLPLIKLREAKNWGVIGFKTLS